MKRIIAIILAALMITALVGCGKQRRKIVELTLSTEDSEAILNAAGIRLPDKEDTPAAGTITKFYAWYDAFHNYAEDEIVNTGYFTFKEKYLDYYNNRRIKLKLKGLTPAQHRSQAFLVA